MGRVKTDRETLRKLQQHLEQIRHQKRHKPIEGVPLTAALTIRKLADERDAAYLTDKERTLLCDRCHICYTVEDQATLDDECARCPVNRNPCAR